MTSGRPGIQQRGNDRRPPLGLGYRASYLRRGRGRKHRPQQRDGAGDEGRREARPTEGKGRALGRSVRRAASRLLLTRLSSSAVSFPTSRCPSGRSGAAFAVTLAVVVGEEQSPTVVAVGSTLSLRRSDAWAAKRRPGTSTHEGDFLGRGERVFRQACEQKTRSRRGLENTVWHRRQTP